MHMIRLTLCFCISMSAADTYANENLAWKADAAEFAWLFGTWKGIGNANTPDQGDVFSVWSHPVEGVFSWTFRWHQPQKQHVHFAFSVFETTNNEILGKGIHHGRDFKTFEEHPWTLKLTDVGPDYIMFTCIAHCRGHAVNLRLLENGQLEESWTSLEGKAGAFVIRYNRQ